MIAFILKIVISAFVVLIPASTFAGFGSNFLFSYNNCDCSPPIRPMDFPDQLAYEIFLSEVEEYKDCVKNYVEKAKKDVDEIIRKSNSAVDEYNHEIFLLRER